MQKVLVFFKKWWKFILVILLGVAILTLVVLKRMFRRSDPAGEVEFQRAIEDIKDGLQEASLKAQIEARVIETKNDALREQLQYASSNTDKSERLKELAKLAKR